jgi:glycine betaine/proline transport system substrate-binding protein
MMIHKTKMLTITALTVTIGSAALAQDIVIGLPNWTSAKGTAYILKAALEENLGLDVALQSGTNPIIFEAMDSGAIHIHPEVWMPNQQNLFNTYVIERGTVKYNPNPVLSEQKFCVTRDTQERTGITALSDLTDPDMAANFDTDGDGMGEVWIGATGWASTNIEKIRAKTYGYDETMTLVEMDEALAFAQVDNAISQGENIVFYCYTPHHMFSLYDLIPLTEPAYDPAEWEIKQPTDDPDWLEKSKAGTAWDSTKLHIFYSASLEEHQPEAADMISKVNLNTEQVNAIVNALVVEGQDPESYAYTWISEHADLVDSWFQ